MTRTSQSETSPAETEVSVDGSTRRSLWLAMLLAAVIAVGAAAPGAWVRATYGAATSGDEPHYLITAISVAEDGDLDVSDEMEQRAYRPFHRPGLPPQAAEQSDGSMVVPHDPLLPALLALPWELGGWRGAKLALALMAGALAALLVWTAVRRFGVRPWTAGVVVSVFAASTPLAQYGTQVYPEVPAALAVTVAVGAMGVIPRNRGLLGVGLAVVALPWLAVKYVPVAAVLAGLALWRLWRSAERRAAFVFVGVLVAAGIAYAVAHLAWYGGITVYAAGDFFQERGGQLTVVGTSPNYLGRTRRLIGLLVGRDFGLAAWQPAWLLMVPALAVLVRRRPSGWGLLVWPLATGWLVATFVALTMQGWWVPGRQLVHVLPLAVLAIAWWGDRRRWRVWAVAALGLVGVATYGWLLNDGLAGRIAWIVDFTEVGTPWLPAWHWLLPDYLDVSAGTWARQSLWLVGLCAGAVLATRERTSSSV